ncbi:MAG: hypothetical protein HKL80_04950 [Acidimicrobiales bacterium]|nr:hypothetical protein [Acidimicrobiales bacterium]
MSDEADEPDLNLESRLRDKLGSDAQFPDADLNWSEVRSKIPGKKKVIKIRNYLLACFLLILTFATGFELSDIRSPNSFSLSSVPRLPSTRKLGALSTGPPPFGVFQQNRNAPQAQGETNGAQSIANIGNKLFTRTTQDGVTLRAFMGTQMENASTENSCSVTSTVTLELSDTNAVISRQVSFMGRDTSPLFVTSISSFGIPEGEQATYLTVQSSSLVGEISVTFADGQTDSMVPVGGFSVLGHIGDPLSLFPQKGTGVINAYSTSGALVASEPLQLTSITPASLPAGGSQSNLGSKVTLPGTIADQSTVSEINASYVNAFDCSLSYSLRSQDFVDPVGYGLTLISIIEGPGGSYLSGAKVQVVEVTLSSPTEANVKYNILFANNQSPPANTSGLMGTAELTNGVWKIKPETMCSIASLAWSSCSI